MMKRHYCCELTSLSQLIPQPSGHVRWLDLPEDFAMLQANYLLRAQETRDKKFSEFARNMTPADFPGEQWKFCAWLEDGEILAKAGVLYMTDRNWEIAAVWTHPRHRGRGYAKAVCAFAARYILENGKRATCGTEKKNTAMRRVMQGIGMTEQKR